MLSNTWNKVACVRTLEPWEQHQSKVQYIVSVMHCTEATFVKKNSCLVARIVSFETAGLHLLTFRILESWLSKDIDLEDVIIVLSSQVLFESMLPSFPYNGNIPHNGNISHRSFSKPCCGGNVSTWRLFRMRLILTSR